ncbi:MAG: glycogen/starch synthase, partial [Eubacteriales bacterium]
MAIKILMVGSEMVPYAATGGLGDVLGSLPAACKRAGGDDIDIRVVLPLYGSVAQAYREQMTFLGDITVPLSWRKLYCGIF